LNLDTITGCLPPLYINGCSFLTSCISPLALPLGLLGVSRVESTSTMAQQEKAQEKLAESTSSVPTSTAAQQSDNVAHALAGAGGGLLSMALTYVSR
jgi:hypothetical protein